MPRHTPEPWVEGQLLDPEGDAAICPRRTLNGKAFVLVEADYERARQCVNVLRGVPDDQLSRVPDLISPLR